MWPLQNRPLLQAEETPTIDQKHEKNATAPGLANEATLKLLPIRVSHLCLRSAYLHRGNALAALGREDEARKSYEMVFPMLENEPRCGRLDWERSSLYVNIGNTFSRRGDFGKADDNYKIAEKLGRDHMDAEEGDDQKDATTATPQSVKSKGDDTMEGSPSAATEGAGEDDEQEENADAEEDAEDMEE